MDIAVIRGGDTGVGLAISRKLITLGFRVYALGESFTKTLFAHKDFFPISMSLANPEELERVVEKILAKENNIDAIINAPAKNIDQPFESVSLLDLQMYLDQNLLNPILLIRLALDKIKQFQGFIINVIHEDPSSPLDGVVKGGLSCFSESLFKNCRNDCVNITNIFLESTVTAPINCEMVANTVDHLVRFRGGNTVTNISICSQDAQALAKVPQITPSIDEFKEIQLPPKSNFPREQKPILTEEPKFISSPSRKPLLVPKVARKAIVIQREKKTRVQKSEEIQAIVKPKRIPRKPNQAKPLTNSSKVTRESVIIPREKKSRTPVAVKESIAKQKGEPSLTSDSKLSTSPLMRTRRGRPSVKENL